MIVCTSCGTRLPPELLASGGPLPCGTCGAEIEVRIFPALFRPFPAGAPGEALLSEGDPGCFEHPRKKAVVPCAWCGRFLCALCDLEFQGEHVCPGCLERGKAKGRLTTLETQRTLYDRVALSLAILPMLLFYFTVITAPIALYMALRHWSSPGSLVSPGKARFVAAILISSLQIFGWAALLVFLLGRLRARI